MSDDARVLRDAMVDRIVREQRRLGSTPPPAVEEAMRRVPRHLFTPGVPLETAYGMESVILKHDDRRGIARSPVSAPSIVAAMLGQCGDLRGKNVLEIGSGGYNAALLRELTGPDGSVTTIDIDPDVVDRAKTCLAAAGYTDVRVLEGDGEHGAAEHPAGFDVIMVTAGAWDIAPAWIDQLAEGGTLVLPLRTLGLTRSWALRRSGDHLESLGKTLCSFVPMQGRGEHTGIRVPLHDTGVGLLLDEEQHVDPAALEGVLSTPRAERWSGVTVGTLAPFDDQDMWLATRLEGFAVLTADQEALDSGVVAPSWRLRTPALIDGPALAYRAKPRPLDTGRTTFEFGVYAHGPAASAAADRFAAEIVRWDRQGRPAPSMTVHPAGTPDAQLPPGFVLDKKHSRIVLSWPDSAAR